jgi:hypothetical protein
MTVFKNKVFSRFARKEGLTDQDVCKAAAEVHNDEYDADLGGGVYKQRVAREGGGKSGGFRTLVLFKRDHHTFFVYGYSKSTRSNIRADELKALRRLADHLLNDSAEEIATSVKAGALIEVECDDDEVQYATEAPD